MGKESGKRAVGRSLVGGGILRAGADNADGLPAAVW